MLRGAIPAEEFSDLLKAAREAEAAFSGARSRKAAAGGRFAAEEEAPTSWLAKARLVVMLTYGSKWSESWIATGFTHRGTNVPKRIAPRIELRRRLADFFTEHGEYEVTFAGVTAADAHAQQKKIATAEREVRLANAEATAKKRARDAAEKRLRRKMRSVVVLLSIPLGKSDPRWLAFGLNRPDTAATPKRGIAAQEPAIASLEAVEFGTKEEVSRVATAAA